jgi:hypothetical protein
MNYTQQKHLTDNTDEDEDSNLSMRGFAILLILGGLVGICKNFFFSGDKYYKGDDLFATKTTLAGKLSFYKDDESSEENYYYFRTTDQKCSWRISHGSLNVIRSNSILLDQIDQLNEGDPVKIAYRVADDHLLQKYNSSVRVLGLSSGSKVFIAAKQVQSRDGESSSNILIISSIALITGCILFVRDYARKNAVSDSEW